MKKVPEAEQKHKSRKIGDLFSDYKTNSNIEDAEIARMNLLKKINTLEIEMQAKEYIEIKEIWYFEKFLRQRFQFEQVHIKIKYAEGVRKKPIADEWENIVCLSANTSTATARDLTPSIITKSADPTTTTPRFVRLRRWNRPQALCDTSTAAI